MLVSPTIIENKRAHLRRKMIKPAAIQISGANFCQGRTVDVSNGGLSISITDTDHQLSTGKSVDIWMSVDESLESVSSRNGKKIPGQIVRVSDDSVAVRFISAETAHAQLNAILLANI
ncbi:MAG: PilZ domain-containing protein [Methylococcales bacterium]|jgi:hypothetical protein|nr:PilZ domain-containing protein [Methylococcales bacterium]